MEPDFLAPPPPEFRGKSTRTALFVEGWQHARVHAHVNREKSGLKARFDHIVGSIVIKDVHGRLTRDTRLVCAPTRAPHSHAAIFLQVLSCDLPEQPVPLILKDVCFRCGLSELMEVRGPGPKLVLVFSGKRKSGKDYITDLILDR